MKDTTKLILTAILVFLLLCILTGGIYAWITWKEPEKVENEIPKITEEYTKVEFTTLKNTTGNFILTGENEIIENDFINDKSYIIGKFGKLYTNKIPYDIDNEYENEITTYKNYKVYHTDDYEFMYYINTKNNKRSKNYDMVSAIINEDTEVCNYFVLTYYNGDNKEIYILNLNTDSVIKLDESIEYIVDTDYYIATVNNTKTLVVSGTNEKYGLIDYSGKIVIDMIYDNLSSVSDTLFIAETNEKFGMINEKNETMLNFIYDTILTYGDYIVVTKDDKLTVLNKSFKTIVADLDIDVSLHKVDDYYVEGDYMQYYAISRNNILYLYTYSSVYIDNNISKSTDKYLKSYTIDKKGIINKIDGDVSCIIPNANDGNCLYHYTVSTKSDQSMVTIYDSEFYEYFKYSIKLKYDGKVDNRIWIYEKDDYYLIEVYYDTGTYDRYYIDLVNSKEISSFKANYKYFDNGYGFILLDNTLTIYKQEKVLETFNNVEEYIGDYMFIVNRDDNYTIEKLEFKKDLIE